MPRRPGLAGGNSTEDVRPDGRAKNKGRAKTHFLFRNLRLYRPRRATDYGDKLQRAIGTTDPGAVPGGSTTNLVKTGVYDGAELGSTWAEKRCFYPG